MAKKKPLGRPLCLDQPRKVSIYLSRKEMQIISKKAIEQGVSMSHVIRTIIRDA